MSDVGDLTPKYSSRSRLAPRIFDLRDRRADPDAVYNLGLILKTVL